MNHPIAAYSTAKADLGDVLGASQDLLHVHAGLLIFFVAALLLRRRMRSWVPICLVWAFAFGNELIDAFSPINGNSAWEHGADIMNTVFWPTLLFLLARRRGKDGEPNQTV
jgi:hypothetical protein